MTTLKLYKTHEIDLNGNKIDIRSYKIGDDRLLVAELMKLQFEVETLSNEDDKLLFLDKRFEMELIANTLANRGLKRSISEGGSTAGPDELDDPTQYPDYDIDPDDALMIAWTMIRLGTPGADKGKQNSPKQEKTKKKSPPKDG